VCNLVLVLFFFIISCFLLVLHLTSLFLPVNCKLPWSLECGTKCSIHSRETTFKKLRLLIGPRALVIPWLITIQIIK
jgi:hypothetical protein